MGLFNNRIKTPEGKTQIPVWFMRQAGRYHSHYQNIKKNSNFMNMCRNPKIACEVTMGPIEEFDFDAAILFSDLLFPLEHMGLGLSYAPGPILENHLTSLEKVKNIKLTSDPNEFFSFQGEACELLKDALPEQKTLLGFVGAPFTLYTYAVDGGHSGNLIEPKKGFHDGRWEAFNEVLFENLIVEMSVQAKKGAEAICLFDTAAGECTFEDYKEFILPKIRLITKEFKYHFPNKKIIYYSKFTHIDYLQEIQDENIDVLGVDWRLNLANVLTTLGNDYMIQGNIDPAHLHLPWPILKQKLASLWNKLEVQNVPFHRWICGLGHGVLQKTPEENVKNTVKYIHENFNY